MVTVMVKGGTEMAGGSKTEGERGEWERWMRQRKRRESVDAGDVHHEFIVAAATPADCRGTVRRRTVHHYVQPCVHKHKQQQASFQFRFFALSSRKRSNSRTSKCFTPTIESLKSSFRS